MSCGESGSPVGGFFPVNAGGHRIRLIPARPLASIRLNPDSRHRSIGVFGFPNTHLAPTCPPMRFLRFSGQAWSCWRVSYKEQDCELRFAPLS
jgi:hypothetical protein